MFQVIRTPNGIGGYNVKIVTPAGDFIEIPAMSIYNADAMAFKIAEVINYSSHIPARATREE